MAYKRKQASKSNSAVLPVMRPDAAGSNIGATEIFVANRAGERVRSFPTVMQDLYTLADVLVARGNTAILRGARSPERGESSRFLAISGE